MINDYPDCNYEGCDMVNIVAQKPTPKQFTFRIANVLEGLPYPDNTFDLVHLRLLALALRYDQWPSVIKELLRVTKPGGLIQMMEPDYRVTEHDDIFCKVVSACKYIVKRRNDRVIYKFFFFIVITICEAKGQNPRIGIELERLLREAGNIKIIETKSASIDTSKVFMTPIKRWKGSLLTIVSLATGSSVAKKIAWSWMEGVKGTMKVSAPVLGLKDEKDQQRFLKEFNHCMETKCGYLHMEAVVAQKL